MKQAKKKHKITTNATQCKNNNRENSEQLFFDDRTKDYKNGSDKLSIPCGNKQWAIKILHFTNDTRFKSAEYYE